MTIIREIAGLGRVELDDSFSKISSAKQQPVISEIKEQAGVPVTPPDFAKIKGNITKMIDVGAPADPYIARVRAIQDALASNHKGGEAKQ
jgi:hypothetical protein